MTPTTLEQLLEEIEGLRSEAKGEDDLERHRHMLWLRHLAGIRALEGAPSDPEFAAPDFAALPNSDGLIEITAHELVPGLLRAAILRQGCLLVRGLIEPDTAIRLCDDIELAFEARQMVSAGKPAPQGYYEEFVPQPPFRMSFERGFVAAGGGVLAADSPRILSDVLAAFDRIDLPPLVDEYFGERGALSVQKTTLRKAEPSVPGGWHQDGAFLGEVRTLNVWVALSRCGDVAPGLDIAPRRLDELVETGGEDVEFSDHQVTQQAAEAAAGDLGVLRPIFEPGDALFFDELFLHKTGSDPEMPNPRYALECWFFGASAFTEEYVPVLA